jgi:peroxiredoxin
LARKAGLTFPLLSDRNAEAIRQYDLLLPKAGEDGRDIGSFAEFLVDASGKVRWRKLSEMAPGSLADAEKALQ